MADGWSGGASQRRKLKGARAHLWCDAGVYDSDGSEAAGGRLVAVDLAAVGEDDGEEECSGDGGGVDAAAGLPFGGCV